MLLVFNFKRAELAHYANEASMDELVLTLFITEYNQEGDKGRFEAAYEIWSLSLLVSSYLHGTKKEIFNLYYQNRTYGLHMEMCNYGYFFRGKKQGSI